MLRNSEKTTFIKKAFAAAIEHQTNWQVDLEEIIIKNPSAGPPALCIWELLDKIIEGYVRYDKVSIVTARSAAVCITKIKVGETLVCPDLWSTHGGITE